LANSSVVTLDICVLLRLTRLNVHDGNIALFRPC
jgi:hypothetical protein